MVQAGAQGVIRKTASLRCVLDCLRMVAAGNTWMDELMFQNGDRTAGAGRSNLTTREQQVAELVEQGLKNKEIANALGICAGTVKIHLKHIFEKTGFAAVTAWRFPGSRNVVTCRRRVTTSAVPTLLAYVPHLRFAEHAGQRVAHVG